MTLLVSGIYCDVRFLLIIISISGRQLNLDFFIMASQITDDLFESPIYSSTTSYNPTSLHSHQDANNGYDVNYQQSISPSCESPYVHPSCHPVVNVFGAYSQPAFDPSLPSFVVSQSASQYNSAYPQQQIYHQGRLQYLMDSMIMELLPLGQPTWTTKTAYQF